jgi:hypothetical protein
MSASSTRSSTCTYAFPRALSHATPSRRQRVSAAEACPAAAEAKPTDTKPTTGASTGVAQEMRHMYALPWRGADADADGACVASARRVSAWQQRVAARACVCACVPVRWPARR